MLENVIESIVEAEKTAEQQVADAEKQAEELTASYEAQAEKIRSEGAERLKAFVQENTAASNEFATAEAKKKVKAGQAEANALSQKYRQNIDKAVEFIVEKI